MTRVETVGASVSGFAALVRRPGFAARSQPSSSRNSAVRSLGVSPVLTVPRGSMSSADTSPSARGQCSTPCGTTKTSPGPSSTSPPSASRNWMTSRPVSYTHLTLPTILLV